MATRSAVCAGDSVRRRIRIRSMHGTSLLLFAPAISSTDGASARRDTGNAPTPAPIGPLGMAAFDLARDRPGCRSRNWIRESRDFYACLSNAIWRHALRFSQESRQYAATINTRCTFHRTADTSATAEGWRLLFQDGFKSWIERIK
jgi:hypothetical protein